MGRMAMSLSVLVLVVMVAGGAAQTSGTGTHQGQGRGQGMGHGPGPMAVLGQLNLTDDQMQQVHKLMADNQAKIQASMQQMQTLHEQLRDQVFADSGPSGDARTTAQKISDMMSAMIQTHVDLAGQISQILTPEQRKKMRELPMGQVMGMMGPMGMGAGGPRRPPEK